MDSATPPGDVNSVNSTPFDVPGTITGPQSASVDSQGDPQDRMSTAVEIGIIFGILFILACVLLCIVRGFKKDAAKLARLTEASRGIQLQHLDRDVQVRKYQEWAEQHGNEEMILAKPELGATQHEICVVCLDPLLDEQEVRGLRCKHVFHAKCLGDWWLEDKTECPICKQVFARPVPKRVLEV